MVRELQLTTKKKKNKKTKQEKRRQRFLHDGALVRGSKVSSVYSTATPPRRQILVPVLTTLIQCLKILTAIYSFFARPGLTTPPTSTLIFMDTHPSTSLDRASTGKLDATQVEFLFT